jgi:hypothetical protein
MKKKSWFSTPVDLVLHLAAIAREGDWNSNLSSDCILSIKFDLKDVEACKKAVTQLYTAIIEYQGIAAANEVMKTPLLSKRDIATFKNARLLMATRGYGYRSVEQAAAEIAERNKSLPNELRYGPTGSTSPSTLAKQIRRLLTNTDDD